MEFTSKQNNVLKQLNNMVKLQRLQTSCEEFKEELHNLIAERSNSLKKREILIESLTSVREELKIAREEECKWQSKLKAANNMVVYAENDQLQSICLLLGYHISKYRKLENNGLQITLHYRDICYVTYNETAQVFDLIEIYPRHANFHEIKEFLHNSQDLRGLLSCLRKYFDFALNYKEKQEQKRPI